MDVPHTTHQLNKTQPEMRSSWQNSPKEPIAVWVAASTHLPTLTCAPQPHPHSLEEPEGPWWRPYGSDEEVAGYFQNCHCLTLLPYANGRPAEPVSPSGSPKESLLDNLTFLLETVKGAMRKRLQSPPTPTCLSREGELLSKLLRRPIWARRESWKLHYYAWCVAVFWIFCLLGF